MTGDGDTDRWNLVGGAGIVPQLTVCVESAKSVGGSSLGGNAIGGDGSGLKLFHKVYELRNIGMTEDNCFDWGSGSCGFEPAVNDRSVEVEVLDLGDDGRQFGLPHLDDRHKVLKDDAGQCGVGGVAVRGEADGFGFWEVEV